MDSVICSVGICTKNKNDQGFVRVFRAAFPRTPFTEREINFNPSMDK